MWTLIVMLHAVSPNVPASKGSIRFPTVSYEECLAIRDKVKSDWSDNRYRVTASCIMTKG